MKSINTSTFDFPTLNREGFVYVDKTAQIYELARSRSVAPATTRRRLRAMDAPSTTSGSATIPPPASALSTTWSASRPADDLLRSCLNRHEPSSGYVIRRLIHVVFPLRDIKACMHLISIAPERE